MNQNGSFKLLGRPFGAGCIVATMMRADTIDKKKKGKGKGCRVGEKFLGTFATQTADFTPGSLGYNQSGPVLVEYQLTSALTVGQKLNLTLPTGIDGSMKPIAVMIWSAADPSLPLLQPHTANALLIESHDVDTGTTVFVAGAAGVADNAVLSCLYVPATVGA